MWKILKKPLIGILQELDLHSSVSLRRGGPLLEDGWFRSFRENLSVDGEGNPLPWITYPAIEFLKRKIRKDMVVFEYGCGMSTLWWERKTKQVIAVEHDRVWYEKMLPQISSNVNLIYCELEYGGAYAQTAAKYSTTFDIVVIDGRDRVNCAKGAMKALKPEGVIVWDNSDREAYQEGYDYLSSKGFRKIGFVGMLPIVNMKSETGIFYRDQNCLGI
jgi:hypothetical protein